MISILLLCAIYKINFVSSRNFVISSTKTHRECDKGNSSLKMPEEDCQTETIVSILNEGLLE